MKALAVIIISVAVQYFLLPSSGLAYELQDRRELSEKSAALLQGEQFAQLETLADELRQKKSRTASGVWQLTSFYAGIQTAVNAKPDEAERWQAAERLVEKWLSGYSGQPTPHLAYAQLLMNHGWRIRGDGYASTVKPENWRPFHEYVEKARVYLEDHKSVASRDPHWYVMMAEIARVQSWPEADFRKMLLEGLELEPYFYQTYFAAIDYYAPKWGGSAAAIEAFAKESLERTKDVEGFGMYARIYWYASQTQYNRNLFSRSLVDWPTMKKGIDDVLRRYPDGWNLNNFAKFACLAKDKAKTAELLARVHTDFVPEAWWPGPLFRRCWDWATPPI